MQVGCCGVCASIRQVACVDLLAPGVGEICGGSLREERTDILLQRLARTAFADTLRWFVSQSIYCYIHPYIHTNLYSAKNRENESEALIQDD